MKLNKSIKKANIELLQEELLKKQIKITELEAHNKELQVILRRLIIERNVTELLRSAVSFDQICEKILATVCENLGFQLGLFWSYDYELNSLCCTKIWRSSFLREETEFELVSQQTLFSPGVGLPGRLLISNKPTWIEDVVKDDNFPRANVANKIGLHSAFGFPILIGCEVFGIMEFFLQNFQPVDENLLDLMANLGNQIGEFNWHNWHGKVNNQSSYFC
ncbi:MAG: GAF domain-containing protein [Acidobacteria bacterium]|nr:GAF domain-containing protein [Acidobacteriota bacterium]